MTGLLERVPVDRVIVAIDPGKVLNRVWITSGEGLLGEPVSLPTSRVGVAGLRRWSPAAVLRCCAGGDGFVASRVGG